MISDERRSGIADGARQRTYHHGNLREALLDAAEAAVSGGAAYDVSVRELGRMVGVSHTSAQRHFTNRRDLLDALAQRGFERLAVVLAEPVDAPYSSFDVRLTRLAKAHVGFAVRHPALFRWMSEAQSLAGSPASLLAARDSAFAPALSIFMDGQAAGAVVRGDPEQLGLASFAAVQGLIAMSSGGKFGNQPLDMLVGSVIERIILGFRPRPEAPSEEC